MTIKHLIIIGVSFFSFKAHAELDKYNQDALNKTQEMLRNKSQRDAVIKNTPQAQEYIQKMNQMGMNGSQQDKTFDITADIFGTLVKDSNGDASAMQKLLLNAQKDPQAFYNSLSPEQKKMIQSLGLEMEARMNGKGPQ